MTSRRLALRVKVGAALTAAHGEAGERVLEGLLQSRGTSKSKRLPTDGGAAALVRTDGGVELYTVAAVDLRFRRRLPRHSELDVSFGLDHTLGDVRFNIVGAALDNWLDGGQDLFNSLKKFGLVGVLLAGLLVNRCKIFVFDCHNNPSLIYHHKLQLD